MEDDDEIIKTDRRNFPNCQYSVSSSQACSNKNGVFVCEAIKNINRLCPQEKPVTIYSKSSKFDSQSEPDFGHIKPFGAFDIFGFGKEFDPNFGTEPEVPGNGKNKSGNRFEFHFGGKALVDDEDKDGGEGFKGFLKQFGIGSKAKGGGEDAPKRKEDSKHPKPSDRVGPPEDI